VKVNEKGTGAMLASSFSPWGEVLPEVRLLAGISQAPAARSPAPPLRPEP
jgi:hypothetical protein